MCLLYHSGGTPDWSNLLFSWSDLLLEFIKCLLCTLEPFDFLFEL